MRKIFLIFATLALVACINVEADEEEVELQQKIEDVAKTIQYDGDDDDDDDDDDNEGSGPRPTVHPSLACRFKFLKCYSDAGQDWQEKKKCYYAFNKCMRGPRPTKSPHYEQCRDEYKKCVGNAGGDYWERQMCMREFRRCARNKPQV